MWNNIHFLDDETLDEIIEQDKVSVINFLVANHLECRKQATVICEMASELGEKHNFIVLDVFECPLSVERFGITDVPAMVFVRKGVPIGGYNGLVKEKHRQELIEKLAFMQEQPLEKQFPGYRLATEEERDSGSGEVVRAGAAEVASILQQG